ncbi:MAG: hypothetical protein AVDCRST_MAG39-277 [uncultured Sphingomonadaceae bacterium]|uniref:Uncharacterized protein n=1 Tax=uncultured Sphingomonadaceae bacterium TaxID=169976 RepID=A0A6J4RYG0_9SPHN|nr:MAG: hypothetical protein AVDCRST_MAG39-277 [uncultured Sphingomonadaceae bacterium]
MANVDGTWDAVVKSPMGEQRSTFTVQSTGDSFTGGMQGQMGALSAENGKVEGDRLTWTMQMTSPFPMTLECHATVQGDSMTGEVKAGAFGSSPLTATRKS